MKRNVAEERLDFTTNAAEAVRQAEVIFIAVGTPMGDEGQADLRYVLAVAKTIGENLDGYKVVVDKSTVPVGTADKVRAEIEKHTKPGVRRRLQPRVPQGGGGDRGLHEAGPRGHRLGPQACGAR